MCATSAKTSLSPHLSMCSIQRLWSETVASGFGLFRAAFYDFLLNSPQHSTAQKDSTKPSAGQSFHEAHPPKKETWPAMSTEQLGWRSYTHPELRLFLERVQVHSDLCDLWAIRGGCPASCMLRFFFSSPNINNLFSFDVPNSWWLSSMEYSRRYFADCFFLMLWPSSFILQNCTSIIIHTTKLHSHNVFQISNQLLANILVNVQLLFF